MSAKGNTTPIGDGSVGVDSDVQSASGQALQAVVSENNLKANLAANGSMKNVYGAAVRMISRWARGDKMRILQEYGSVEMLRKNASDDEINNAVATVLISHMPKEELRKIIGKEEVTEKKIIKDVAGINAKSFNARKQQFSANNLGSQVQTNAASQGNLAKSAGTEKQLLKGIKKQGALVTPKEGAEFKKISKELNEVLKGMTNLQLSAIAARLEMNVDDSGGSASRKTIIKYICNMVNMYTILLTEKETAGISPAKFTKDVIDQLEELLLLTSGGWMTGKVGINDLTLRAKRKAALEAKRQLKNNIQAKEIKEKARNAIKIKKKKIGAGKGNIKEISFSGLKIGKRKRAKATGLSKTVRDKLDKLSDDQIRDLAQSQGLQDIETKTIDNLKDELALMGGSELQQINEKTKKDLAQVAKIKDPVKRAMKMEELKTQVKAAQRNSILGAAVEGESGSQEYSDKIPVVSFNQNGDLVSTGLLKAVPVYIAGSASKLGKLMNAEEADDLKKMDSDELRDAFKDAFENEFKSDKLTGSRKDKRLAKKIGKRITDTDISKLLASKGSKLTDKKPATASVVAGGLGTGGKLEETIASGTGAATPAAGGINIDAAKINEVNDKFAAIAKNASLVSKQNNVTLAADSRWTADIDKKLKDEEDQSKVPIKSFIRGTSGYFGKRSGKVYANATVNRGASVNPVYVVNKGFDFFDNGLQETIKATSSATQQIASQVEQLPTLFMGLQQGGTAFNAEAAASGVAMALNVANQAATAAAQFATGGSMRGGNKISQIITGDHPQGKNNTELVSVDWNNRNINVKPIPMMASGGDVQSNNASNITGVKRMTSSERSKPMIVSIGTGVVKYDKELQDAKDDGSGTAVKVYSVNSGINEKVKVGDVEMSLFDAVYGVYTSMAALVSGVSTSNQLLASISSTSTAAARSINRLAASGGNNSATPFSFTSELDDVLAGR